MSCTPIYKRKSTPYSKLCAEDLFTEPRFLKINGNNKLLINGGVKIKI